MCISITNIYTLVFFLKTWDRKICLHYHLIHSKILALILNWPLTCYCDLAPGRVTIGTAFSVIKVTVYRRPQRQLYFLAISKFMDWLVEFAFSSFTSLHITALPDVCCHCPHFFLKEQTEISNSNVLTEKFGGGRKLAAVLFGFISL